MNDFKRVHVRELWLPSQYGQKHIKLLHVGKSSLIFVGLQFHPLSWTWTVSWREQTEKKLIWI